MVKQGFNSKLTKWTCAFLSNQSTTFKWSEFKSGAYQASISTPQGAGLSPSFSRLLIAPVIHDLFPLETMCLLDSEEDYIFFVDDSMLMMSHLKILRDKFQAVRYNAQSLGYAY